MRADALIRSRLDENAARPGPAARRVHLHPGVDVAKLARALSRHGYRAGALAPDKGWSEGDGYLRPDGHEIEIASHGVAGPLELRHWGPEANQETGPTKILRSTQEAIRYLKGVHRTGLLKPHDWRKAPEVKNRLHATMRRR